MARGVAVDLIEYVMGVEVDRANFLEEKEWKKGQWKSEGLMNLLLAADCFSEVDNPKVLESLKDSMFVTLQQQIEQPPIELSWEAVRELFERIARDFPETLHWLKQRVLEDT